MKSSGILLLAVTAFAQGRFQPGVKPFLASERAGDRAGARSGDRWHGRGGARRSDGDCGSREDRRNRTGVQHSRARRRASHGPLRAHRDSGTRRDARAPLLSVGRRSSAVSRAGVQLPTPIPGDRRDDGAHRGFGRAVHRPGDPETHRGGPHAGAEALHHGAVPGRQRLLHAADARAHAGPRTRRGR